MNDSKANALQDEYNYNLRERAEKGENGKQNNLNSDGRT